MNIQELTKGIHGCACGKDHACPIDFVEISHGAVEKMVTFCDAYTNIVLVADTNTFAVCGKRVNEILGDKVQTALVLEDNGHVVVPNEEKIAEIQAVVTADTDLIVGVGSGVINDLCKHVSFLHDLPYVIVATAPSMDGYASVGAALILGGMKITLNARPPKGIVADTAVLKDAPIEMLRAGYGDIVGKYSCLNDWKLAALIYDEYFCQTVYDLTYHMAKRVETLADGVANRDEQAVGALMEALVAVGIAMSYVGTSRPASGSEHHLSHFFEITGILDNTPYFSHGIDVAYAAVVTAKLREELQSVKPVRRAFNRAAWESEIRRVYTSSADGVIAQQDKLDWYNRDDEAVITSRWGEIQALLAEAPTAAAMQAMVERVGLKFDEFEELYGAEKIADAVKWAKDLKDRYSVLWLYGMYN